MVLHSDAHALVLYMPIYTQAQWYQRDDMHKCEQGVGHLKLHTSPYMYGHTTACYNTRCTVMIYLFMTLRLTNLHPTKVELCSQLPLHRRRHQTGCTCQGSWSSPKVMLYHLLKVADDAGNSQRECEDLVLRHTFATTLPPASAACISLHHPCAV